MKRRTFLRRAAFGMSGAYVGSVFQRGARADVHHASVRASVQHSPDGIDSAFYRLCQTAAADDGIKLKRYAGLT